MNQFKPELKYVLMGLQFTLDSEEFLINLFVSAQQGKGKCCVQECIMTLSHYTFFYSRITSIPFKKKLDHNNKTKIKIIK
jgi:hypothetical protein